MIIIMKTNIDLTKDFTMADIISKEFVFYVRDYIKELEKDQKIAKRDRKTVKHPCPEQRKYSTYEAYCKVLSQRWLLSGLYEAYYFMKKNKDFDWAEIKFTHKTNWIGKVYLSVIYPEFEDEKFKDCRFLNTSYSLSFNCLEDVIKKYVEDGRE